MHKMCVHSATPTSDGDGAHSIKHHMCCQWNGSAGCWQRPVRPQPLLHCPPSALPLYSGPYHRSLKGEEKKHTEEGKRSGKNTTYRTSINTLRRVWNKTGMLCTLAIDTLSAIYPVVKSVPNTCVTLQHVD